MHSVQGSHDCIFNEIIFRNPRGVGIAFGIWSSAARRDKVVENAIDGDGGAVLDADIGGVGFSGEIDVGVVGKKEEIGDFAGAVELAGEMDTMADHFRQRALMRCMAAQKGGQCRDRRTAPTSDAERRAAAAAQWAR